MSLPWIKINSKLQQGVALINMLNKSKYNILIRHIMRSEKEKVFTEEELVKLEESLKLDRTQLQLMILSIAHILKQSNKIILKPTTFQDQLIDHLKLDPEKAEEFVKLWTQKTNKIFDLESTKTLENISWELDIQAASKYCNKERTINARLQLAVASVVSLEKENITLELDEKELEHLYGALDTIQKKLDNM